MTVSDSFLKLQARTRPQLLALARDRKLMEYAFSAFQQQVYDGASLAQIAEMRICFFAGAAELLAMQAYGFEAESGSDEPTGEDLQFMDNLAQEIEAFHQATVARTMPTAGRA